MLNIIEYTTHESDHEKMRDLIKATSRRRLLGLGWHTQAAAKYWLFNNVTPDPYVVVGKLRADATAFRVLSLELPSAPPTLVVPTLECGMDEVLAIYLYHLRWQHEQGGINDAAPYLETDPRASELWQQCLEAAVDTIRHGYGPDGYGSVHSRSNQEKTGLQHESDVLYIQCASVQPTLEEKLGLLSNFFEGRVVVGAGLATTPAYAEPAP